MTLVSPENLAQLLRVSLEGSGFFGARFRECAGRALLLTKARFNQRLPLWMSRMQAKKLMAQVKKLDNFPVMVETWRTCLDDEFDIPALLNRLQELHSGEIRWSFVTTNSPSPFAHNLTFGQVSRYMYADDTPEDTQLSVLGDDVISQALHNDALRPQIDQSVIAIFIAKRQRRFPGYAPSHPDDWHNWLKERVLIADFELPDDLPELESLRWINVGDRCWATHAELEHGLYASGLVPGEPPSKSININELRSSFDIAREVLSFYGPLTQGAITDLLPSIPEGLLSVDEGFIHGTLVAQDEQSYWCDAENFEALMRFARAGRRSHLEPLPASALPGFWASYQQLGRRMEPQALLTTLERLRCYPCAASTWWYDLLPARLVGVDASAWDSAAQDYGFTWLGTGKEQLAVGFAEDLELITPTLEAPEFAASFVDPRAGYRFDDVADQQTVRREVFNQQWWQAVWRGALTSDSFAPVRQGLERKFTLQAPASQLSSRRRLRRSAPGWQGNWSLTRAPQSQDALTRLEADKEVVRLLLDRYGWINRDIVNRERLPSAQSSSTFRWRHAFRALRVMELSGEVMTGQFFEQLATPQFISASALSSLQQRSNLNTTAETSWWVAANDPISPCGLGLDWPELPQRRANNYLSFTGDQLTAVFEHSGKHLHYYIDPDSEGFELTNASLVHLVNYRRLHVRIETINQQPARQSPYLAGLARQFQTAADHKSVTLQPPF